MSNSTRDLAYLSRYSQENPGKFLSRGVKVPRFRKTQKQIKNRILYAILLTKDIKFSELAILMGVTPRTTWGWIVLGTIPSEYNMKLICEKLDYPQHILFNEDLLSSCPILCLPSKSKYVITRSSVKNEILHGLLMLYDISIKDTAHWCELHPATLRKYIHNNAFPNEIFQIKLSHFFRIPRSILFYSILNR